MAEGETIQSVAAQSYCNGYFTGFQAGFYTKEIDNGKTICVPGMSTPDEIKRVFLKYVRNNPATMHEFIGVGIIRALKDAYPCETGHTK
jgi:hypothetical protein